MEQKEVLKKIREYHIIKEILEDPDFINAELDKDDSVKDIVDVFKKYVESFGKMKINELQTFDSYFNGFKDNYAGQEFDPQSDSYTKYVADVLTKDGLEQVTIAFTDNDENKEILKAFRMGLGRAAGESYAVMVAALINNYAIAAAYEKESDKDSETIANLREQVNQLNENLKNAKDKDKILEEVQRIKEAMLLKIVEIGNNVNKNGNNDELTKAIEKASGATISEIKKLADDSKLRDDATQKKIEKLEEIIKNAFGEDGSVFTKLDEISKKVDKKSRAVSFWKGVAIGGGVGVAGMLATAAILSANQPDISQTVVVDNSIEDEYDGLLFSLLNNIIDGQGYSEEEKQAFENDVNSFKDKYVGTPFKAKSEGFASELLEFSNKLASMTEEKLTAVQQYADLYVEFNNLKNDVESLNGEKAELQSKIVELEGKIKELQGQLENAKNDSQIQALEAKIAGYEKQVADLKTEVEKYKSENSTLTNENESLKSEKEELQGNINKLTEENKKLNADLQTANDNLLEAQKTIADLNKAKDDLQTKYDAGVITEKELRDRIAALVESEKNLEKQVKDLTSDIGDLNTSLIEEEKKYNDLIDKYNKLNGDKTALAKSLEDAKKRIAELESQVNQTTTQAAELIFDIYEYLTGEKTTDLELAMQTVSGRLGIIETTPSNGVENNVMQPER